MSDRALRPRLSWWQADVPCPGGEFGDRGADNDLLSVSTVNLSCGDDSRGRREAPPLSAASRSEVVALPVAGGLTVQAAADSFLDAQANPNTARAYAVAVGKTADHLGGARPLQSVADDEVGQALELLWGSAAVNTWKGWHPNTPERGRDIKCGG